jgi:hypothetical protein
MKFSLFKEFEIFLLFHPSQIPNRGDNLERFEPFSICWEGNCEKLLGDDFIAEKTFHRF